MDSLPGQHIADLPGATQKDIFERVARLCRARSQGRSEEQAVKMADWGSPEAAYDQLKRFGLPGLVPPKTAGGRKDAPRRNRRSPGPLRGDPEELPPAANAADLFACGVDALKSNLRWIRNLKEIRRGKTFEAVGYYPEGDEKAPVKKRMVRSEYEAEDWAELCNRHGKDPETTEELWASEGDIARGRGVGPHPHHHVVNLIIAYLLNYRTKDDLDALLGRIHPRWAQEEIREETRKEFNRILFGNPDRPNAAPGLFRLMNQAASVARGVPAIGRGRPKRELDMFEHGAVLYIEEMREEGISEPEITRELREYYGIDETQAKDWQEIRRDGNW